MFSCKSEKEMALKKNDEIKLNIESVTSEGSGIGRYEGMAVFVSGTAPGDEILAHIIKATKSYAVGIVKEIITHSPQRVESDCPVSSKCGGCAFRHISYEAELEYKLARVNDAMKRIGHIDIKAEEILAAPEINHYRNKAQYPVHIENGVLTAGFYANKSHRVIPCEACLLHPPEFERGIAAFAKWVKKNNITSYDEKTGRGLLRHIYFRKAFATGQIMACAVINGIEIPDKDYLIAELQQAFEKLESVVVNINSENTNVILGRKTLTLRGSDKITDELLGRRFVISPESFYQVNHAQCERLYQTAAEFAGLIGNETVLDMFCGAGTIGLTLADKCRELIGVEIVPSAIENARENAQLNGVTNARFICADAFEGAKQIKAMGVQPDIAIVDPPRKGCQRELFDVFDDLGINKIVYVSCDPATLARDAAILYEKGFKIDRLKAVDLFPRTVHVECVSLFTR